ncbi:LysE family translocator [Thalassotalea sp. 1_MG-2023]|uniref:LysE family translocator n=1 Tax=Thalassotalea sp. 1_MG-2023 TaxID=3062680 RepID=UPI0026E45E83|nr:LysE family translocator [Thalassotalea sp. 1_MG-2023]MDO6427213.1 LysE family translocator [Thalassotalea sp. 1_MG-2023]
MELLALVLFILSSSGTPGPNNVMLLTSGVNHGFRKSLAHVLGINIGFPIMVIAVGFGLVTLFRQFPNIYLMIKIIGILYLLFLAYKIATLPVEFTAKEKKRPFTFMQAATFQWVNPKAWVMAVSAIIAFTSSANSENTQVFYIAAAYLVFGLPCSLFWLSMGTGLQTVLKNPRFIIWFNRFMALILVLSIVPMIESTIAI